MDSPLSRLRMKWEHEPGPVGRARSPQRAEVHGTPSGAQRNARPTCRLMESLERHLRIPTIALATHSLSRRVRRGFGSLDQFPELRVLLQGFVFLHLEPGTE